MVSLRSIVPWLVSIAIILIAKAALPVPSLVTPRSYKLRVLCLSGGEGECEEES